MSKIVINRIRWNQDFVYSEGQVYLFEYSNGYKNWLTGEQIVSEINPWISLADLQASVLI